MDKKLNKLIKFILVIAMTLQTIVFVNPTNALSSSTSEDVLEFNGITLNNNQQLVDNLDGTYTLTMDITSSFDLSDYNSDSAVAKKDYFVASRNGWYLVELWGGKGGNGESTQYGDGGTGGTEGYVYGKVSLNKGDVLFYNLGGNGKTTDIEDQGGGINGAGGGHGSSGSVGVGGGGGYSAVFKFTEKEYSKYIDEDGNLLVEDITEADRISKYIMIAAGGGGGGAGNQRLFGFIGQSQNRAPDGGAGGSIDSLSGVLTGEGYSVQGTYFIGEDGKSSGDSTEYIGHGATNVPGVISDTVWGWLEGKQPNDWEGAQNPNYNGGSGGSGNLSGGAGGAGYAGGSGGIQEIGLQVIAYNIGGGGGGSSFIESNVDYVNVDTTLLTENRKNPSNTGGAVNITYITDEEIKMSNFVLEGNTSKYFTIVSDVDKSNVTKGALTISDGNDSFEVSIPTLIPDDEKVILTLTLKPIEGFAGGNNVPLFEGMFDLNLQVTEGSAIIATIIDVFSLEDNVSYVNVPLNFDLVTNSYSYNGPQLGFAVEKLYETYKTTYDTLLANYQIDLRYDFIHSIGNIIVQDSTTNVVSGNININQTTRFNVSYDVTLKNIGVAVVGNEIPQKSTISKEAVVSILEAGETLLNGTTIDYSKNLTYDEQNNIYNLSLNVKASASDTTTTVIKDEQKYEYGTTTTSYIIPEDGYYLIQAWGGNGGDGADNFASGGTGGTGGYVSAYMHFEEGERIYFQIGANGTNATNNNSGGQGGTYTAVSYNTENNFLIISGGAGGGGNGGRSLTLNNSNGSDGQSVSNSTSNVLNSSLAAYNGTAGGPGGTSGFFWGTENNGGSGGTAGSNYLSSLMIIPSSSDPLTSSDTSSSSDFNPADSNGGAVYIKCLQSDETSKTDEIVKNELIAQLSNYIFDTQISQYFTINDVSLTGVDTSDGENYSVITTDNKVNISDLNPTLSTSSETNNETSLTTYTYSYDYTINIALKPKEGFLGGNDVPVLVYGDLETGMEITQDVENTQTSKIAKMNETDFANVEIPNVIKATDLIIQDQTYIIGYDADGISKSELFAVDGVFEDFNSYTWEDDFVGFVLSGEDESDVLTPTQTTTYPITIGIEPKADAKIAVVVNSVEGITFTKDATIYVEYGIFYELENMITSHNPANEIYSVKAGEDYSVVLSPATGYLTPNAIKVKVGENEIFSFMYDKETGELTIPSSVITDYIKITATGVVQTFKLTYNYQIEPDVLAEEPFEQYYEAGKKISSSDISNIMKNVDLSNKHYSYIWEWGGEIWNWEDEENPKVMPSYNWWVNGMFIPNEYKLTINYIRGDHVEKVQHDVTYGSDYSFTSPAYDGYVAEHPILNLTIDENFEINGQKIQISESGEIVIDVNYNATANQLVIYYVYSDKNTIFDTYQTKIATDANYNVPVSQMPKEKGYSPNSEGISGIMPATGVVYYVYYNPNTYKVTFDANEGNTSVESINVTYNAAYGINSPFPTPNRLGYDFAGWYLGDNKITETSIVETADNHTLTAKWTARKYFITIKYVYEDGSEAKESVQFELAVGETYSHNVDDDIVGHTPDQSKITGIVIPSNTTIIVTYIAEEYAVGFNDENGNKLVDDITVKYQLPYGFDGVSIKELPTPTKEGYSFNGWYYNDKQVTKDTIVTTTGSHDLTAKWLINSYTLVIHYVYEDGSQAQLDVVRSYEYLKEYKHETPVIQGYTADIAEVKGVMTENTEITVTYIANKYTLTINYLDETGNTVKDENGIDIPSYTAEIKYGTSYKIDSPIIDELYCSLSTVEGVMDDVNGKTVNVYYYKNDPTKSVYVVNHHLQNLDGKTYTISDKVSGDEDINTEINLSSIVGSYTGYTLNKTKGNATSDTISLSQPVMTLDLYYDRNSYNYTIQYVSEDALDVTNPNLGTKTVSAKYGATVIESATPFDGYVVKEGTDNKLSLTISVNESSNVIIFTYVRNVIDVHYVALCTDNSINFGTLSNSEEKVVALTNTSGSEAVANVNYVFVGWYLDERCVNKVESGVTGSKLVPVVDPNAKSVTYYALFSPVEASLTITITDGNENDMYLFEITGMTESETIDGVTVSNTFISKIVAISGKGTETIVKLPLGSYEVKPLNNWSWRYKGVAGESPSLSSNNGLYEIKFSGFDLSNGHWLGEETRLANSFKVYSE